MMRLMLLGLLAASTTGCGKSSTTGPAVTAGATVGVVVEIAGTVTATRSGEPRALAAGAEVSGDDVIETAANSKVAIELEHNGARWSLGAGKRGQVSESVAWSLPKVTGPAGAVSHDMSSAGRHAEHSSADTAASAGKPISPTMPGSVGSGSAAGQPHAGSAGVPSGGETDKSKSKDTQQARDEARQKALDAIRKLQNEQAEKHDRHSDPRDDRLKGVKISKACQENPLARECDDTPPPPPPPPPPVDLAAEGAVVVQNDAAMLVCLGAIKTSQIVITCDGACTLTSASNVDAKARTCLGDRLGKLTLARGRYTITVNVGK